MLFHRFIFMHAQHAPTMACWWIVILTLPFVTGFGTPRIVDSPFTPTRYIQAGDMALWRAIEPPTGISAKAYLLFDVDANQIIFAENIDIALPMASLTKLMTALLVLEKGDLQSEVVIQSDDLIGGASMGLVAGEVLTVEELLRGLLIPSGNDAAAALSRHSAGSVTTFVEQMNRRAATLGLTRTHFINPHGLDAEGHHSSVADLLILVKQNWDFPLFREIVGTAQATIGLHTLRNTNELLGVYDGANGIKTGTTDAAGECLVAGIERDGHQAIGIVLGSTDRYQDMLALHRQYLASYSWIVGEINTISVLNRLYAPDGTLWYLRADQLPPTLLSYRVERQRLHPFRRITRMDGEPWQSGMEVGVVEWQLGDVIIGTQRLHLW